MHGRLDHDLGVHVAALMGAQHVHALGAQAELLAGLGARGNGDARAAAIDRRHLDDAAQCGGRHGDRDAAEDIGAFALEQLVGRDGQEDVEIATRRAAQPGLALAGQADAGSVLHARGDGDVEGLVLAAAALAAAGPAGLVDDLAGALAAGAGGLDGEEALGMADLAAAAAGRAADGLGALLRPAAPASLARRERADADHRLLAAEGLLEADLHVVAQIAAALARLLAAPSAHELAKHLLEDVGETAPGGEVEARRMGAAAMTVLEGPVAEAVIGRALLIVLQDVIGLVDFLELVLGGLVPRIAVRVELHCEPPIGLLELLRRGVARYTEGIVIVLLRHSLSRFRAPVLLQRRSIPALNPAGKPAPCGLRRSLLRTEQGRRLPL